MRKRTRAVLLGATGLVVIQLVFWLTFRAVQQSRRLPADTTSESVAGGAVPLSATLQRSDGTYVTLATVAASQPMLLHFWATWCAPCKDELPTLLELARQPSSTPLAIVLVSLDDDWRPIESFLGTELPPFVVRDPERMLSQTLPLSTLPDTYLIGRRGEVLARFNGARDWRSDALRAELARLATAGGSGG